jgi:hypothetical protein
LITFDPAMAFPGVAGEILMTQVVSTHCADWVQQCHESVCPSLAISTTPIVKVDRVAFSYCASEVLHKRVVVVCEGD